MLAKNVLDEVSASSFLAEGHDVVATRRILLLAALAAGLPLAASTRPAKASKLDPAETVITFSDAIKFVPWSSAPPHSGEVATLYGGLDKPGPYLVLMKWYPGYMSAPHSYATDRLSLVLSGTWWVNSGAQSDGPGAGRRLRPPRRSHSPLRRREARREGAGGDCAVRHCAG
jgi:hypothetical protein